MDWTDTLFVHFTAEEYSEEGFNYASGLFLRQLGLDCSSHGIIHLLADKRVHVGLFCLLAMLLWKAFPKTARKILFILLLGAAAGSFSEILRPPFSVSAMWSAPPAPFHQSRSLQRLLHPGITQLDVVLTL